MLFKQESEQEIQKYDELIKSLTQQVEEMNNRTMRETDAERDEKEYQQRLYHQEDWADIT